MKRKANLILRLVAAIILVQTLYFKFSGAAESRFIFESLHAEPWGRWFSGLIELITAALILIPATQSLGAFLGLGVMSGALLSHVFVLGISIQDDGGLLFGLACVVWLACAVLLYLEKDQFKKWVSYGRSKF